MSCLWREQQELTIREPHAVLSRGAPQGGHTRAKGAVKFQPLGRKALPAVSLAGLPAPGSFPKRQALYHQLCPPGEGLQPRKELPQEILPPQTQVPKSTSPRHYQVSPGAFSLGREKRAIDGFRPHGAGSLPVTSSLHGKHRHQRFRKHGRGGPQPPDPQSVDSLICAPGPSSWEAPPAPVLARLGSHSARWDCKPRPAVCLEQKSNGLSGLRWLWPWWVWHSHSAAGGKDGRRGEKSVCTEMVVAAGMGV